MSPAKLLRWFYRGWAGRRGPARPGGPRARPDLPRPPARREDRSDPRVREQTPPARDADDEADVDWDFLWIDLGGEG